MDIEKLIEAVKLCGSTPKVDQCKQCAYWSGGDMSKCIPRMTTAAADALEKLQAELNVYKSLLKQLVSLPDCNTCHSEHCTYRPNIGAFTRINCPLWRGQKED